MMEQFFTPDIANEGKKMELFTPSGEKTEHYLMIRSVDSDEYENAKIIRDRKLIEAPDVEDEEAYQEFIKSLRLDMLVPLVAGWSFPDECSPGNVRRLLSKAKQITRMIENISSSKSFFYSGSEINSESSSQIDENEAES